ncbi:AlcB [Geosmithia morbida]|uniref:AlcB n=1 Tax=Geosmithia morbida TaxID=1094350 RepID=A0A9P4YSK9_9HYPO|nr:AlcB [Geosmithia morbida]KAF4122010.1 AlcB [Geosmithia morbida]
MVREILHLPDGQTFTVSSVFGGLSFKSHEMNTHHHAFPAGWTIILHTENGKAGGKDDNGNGGDGKAAEDDDDLPPALRSSTRILPFETPTLRNDALFISTISNPADSEFKPAASPTRQIAMMLWVTLYWYFHQTEPRMALDTEPSRLTPEEAKPRGEWSVRVKRDGILRGRNLIPKLERMGLIASADTAVGTHPDDDADGWTDMFVSRRMFWQIPPGLFLFTLARARTYSSHPGSPNSSRPASPTRESKLHPLHRHTASLEITSSSQSALQRFENDLPGAPVPTGPVNSPGFPVGPFYSSSHLPTYYPPPPPQYRMTDGIRHPLRPKPPRMGETFYSRFVPSVGQYLSFRVASSSPKPVPHLGPVGPDPPQEHQHLTGLSDTALMRRWLSNPRVSRFWGEYFPGFLEGALKSRHSFPAIGLWDGVPFGFFEVYWVKEDMLGHYLNGEAADWDRGLHVMVGEEWARGRVSKWLSALVHWCLLVDYRTMNICLEPRIDNER